MYVISNFVYICTLKQRICNINYLYAACAYYHSVVMSANVLLYAACAYYHSVVLSANVLLYAACA